MTACPLCGAVVAEERPRHRVTLEIEDTTRSTKQFMGDEADVKRYCIDRQLCPDCWDDLRTDLS